MLAGNGRAYSYLGSTPPCSGHGRLPVFAAEFVAVFVAVFVACAGLPLAEGSAENSGRPLIDDVAEDVGFGVCFTLARASVRARVLLS